jgi:anti-sigma B factor antagonist
MSHSVRTKRGPGVLTVEAIGDVDAAAADELNGALSASAEGPEPAELVIVDLTETNLLDSRSIGILADWRARIRARGGTFAIAGARPEVRRLFTMIGLEQTFDFFATADDAIAGRVSPAE